MRNLQKAIDETDYQNEPIITNLARLSGTTSHAVSTYLIEKELKFLMKKNTEEEIAKNIISFYDLEAEVDVTTTK